MGDEPLSEERLAEINGLTADVLAGRIHVRFDEETAWLAILDARREVERLRADNLLLETTITGTEKLCDKLRAENATMRSLVSDLATMPNTSTGWDGAPANCPWCEQDYDYKTPEIQHTPDCPVTKARELLAKNPT